MESPMKTTRSSPAAGGLDLLVIGRIAAQIAVIVDEIVDCRGAAARRETAEGAGRLREESEGERDRQRSNRMEAIVRRRKGMRAGRRGLPSETN